MTIDSVSFDSDNAVGLGEWLASDEAGKMQRQTEEKILRMLFSSDPSTIAFQRMITRLALLGTRGDSLSLLEKDIAILRDSHEYSLQQTGFKKTISKASRATKKFLSDHAWEIAAGAAICATGIGLAYVTGYALSVSVGGVVVVGTGSIFSALERKEPKIVVPPLPKLSKSEAELFRQPLISSTPLALPTNANDFLVTADGVWANGQFYPTTSLQGQSWLSPMLANGQVNGGFIYNDPMTNWQTVTYQNSLSSRFGPAAKNDVFSQIANGENALALGQYHQAVEDFSQAIGTNPKDPLPYLERGAARFNLGQYDASLEDYQTYIQQNPIKPSGSIVQFSTGFARGFRNGAYESGEGLLLLLTDFVTHPIQTSGQVMGSIAVLVDLVRKDEWGVIAQSLSPEAHQLVTQWDKLSPERRGELAGYAIGKHGADFVLPGTIAKVASKSVQGAQELATVCKNIKLAQETLALETAAGIGNGAKVAEVIRNGQTMMSLSEEVGLTTNEIVQLKQAGKLEGVINSRLDRLVSQSESGVLKAAINQDKHVNMVRDYLSKPAQEIQKSIRSYEKLIAEHKEKISNPSKFIPHWNTLHPERQHALINKKWPAEIQCYTEQKNMLQSILNERIN